MLQNYNKYKLMRIFLYSATESFRLRELSRMSRISPLSVTNYLKEFQKQGIVVRYVKRGIPYYRAERDNNDFRMFQKISVQYELHASGLIDHLWNTLAPQVIIVYGSHAKGDAIERSDIDIFIIGKEQSVDLALFEKKLNKKVHLMFSPDVRKISAELKNNLINGIILKGYLKVC